MAKTAPLNNVYLGILSGEVLVGNQLSKPTPNNVRVPFDAGSMFLDFPMYDAPIDPANVMMLENKFDIDYHNDVIARQYMMEVEKARTQADQQEYNNRQFEFNENEMITKNIKQRLLEIKNSMIPQADKDAKVMAILRDLGRQQIGAKRGYELLMNAYFEMDMKPSVAVRAEIGQLQSHIRDQAPTEQEQKVGTDKTAEDAEQIDPFRELVANDPFRELVDDAKSVAPRRSRGGVPGGSAFTEVADPTRPFRPPGRPPGSKNRVPLVPGQVSMINFVEAQSQQFAKMAPLNQRDTVQGVADVAPNFASPRTPPLFTPSPAVSYRDALVSTGAGAGAAASALSRDTPTKKDINSAKKLAKSVAKVSTNKAVAKLLNSGDSPPKKKRGRPKGSKNKNKK